MTKSIAIRIQCSNEEDPMTKDVSKLLYDLVLTHDYGVMFDGADDVPPPPFFWRQNGRLIAKDDQLRTARIVKESPLDIELILGSITALWVLMQVIEKARNWELNREKLELEVRKLKRERYGNLSNEIADLMSRVRADIQHTQLERFAKRLKDNSIKIQDWELIPKEDHRDES